MDPPAEVLLSYLYPHFIFRHPTAPQLLLPPLYSLSLCQASLCRASPDPSLLGWVSVLSPAVLSPLSSPLHDPPLSLSNRPRQKKKKKPASPCQAPESCTVRGCERERGREGGIQGWRSVPVDEKVAERERERELFFEGSGTMIFRPCSISRGKSIPWVARR